MVCTPLMRSLQLREKGSRLHTFNSRVSRFSDPQKDYAEPATLPLGFLGAQGDRASRKGPQMIMEIKKFASQASVAADAVAGTARAA